MRHNRLYYLGSSSKTNHRFCSIEPCKWEYPTALDPSASSVQLGRHWSARMTKFPRICYLMIGGSVYHVRQIVRVRQERRASRHTRTGPRWAHMYGALLILFEISYRHYTETGMLHGRIEFSVCPALSFYRTFVSVQVESYTSHTRNRMQFEPRKAECHANDGMN